MKKLYKIYVLILALSSSQFVTALPVLNSNPTAQATVFLDFDGHYVVSSVFNGGSPINCAASGLTDPQITIVFNRVAEDYRPFDVNITTDSTKFLSAPIDKRIRIIVTPTSAWRPGVGGIAYIGSFLWGNDTPAFVFVDRLPVGGPMSPKLIGECCSHESGHTLGLSHQSRYDISNCAAPIEEYHSGAGTGSTSWAPIMGNSYYKNMTGWNDGPTPFECIELQDNLDILTTQNGFGYRVDDYTETMDAGSSPIGSGTINKSGVITTGTDRDVFRMVLAQNSNFSLQAKPYSIGGDDDGANLDIKITLHNDGGTIIKTYDPLTSMSVSIDTVLNAGTYYLRLDGTGNNNATEYGSLGSYTITGATGPLPIRSVVLAGNNNNNRHNLSWKIVADEPIREIVIEASQNGTNFSSLQSTSGAATKFSYQPFNNQNMYYRLKATSVIDQTVYSNVVVLNSQGFAGKQFDVSSFVTGDITINASQAYQYRILDANGKTVSQGAQNRGLNRVSLANQPNGLYIIQIVSNNEIQSERIIKQ